MYNVENLSSKLTLLYMFNFLRAAAASFAPLAFGVGCTLRQRHLFEAVVHLCGYYFPSLRVFTGVVKNFSFQPGVHFGAEFVILFYNVDVLGAGVHF